jgi:4-amino-4-deoxy-L-arabinose transferase-like glycosyltransferase
LTAVYRLGCVLASEPVGQGAALLFATAPFVVYCLLRLQLDLPLAAMVALALVAILATEDFTRRGASVLCGVIAGLGMLTKPTFALYVLPPRPLPAAALSPPRLLGAALTVVVAAAVSLPWFGPRLCRPRRPARGSQLRPGRRGRAS